MLSVGAKCTVGGASYVCTVFPGSPSFCAPCRTPAVQGQAGVLHRVRHRTLSLPVGRMPLQVLQNFSNIEEDCTVCPSWCLTLRAQGHSYRAALEHHIPQYSLEVPKVSMAPAAGGGGTGEPGFCLGLQIPLPSLMV